MTKIREKLEEAREQLKNGPQSRAVSLAITKIEEALMWLDTEY